MIWFKRSSELGPRRPEAALAALLFAPALSLGADPGGAPDPPADDDPATGRFTDTIDVVSSTPLGRGLPEDRAPWSSTRVENEELDDRGMSSALERAAPGVHLSEVQGSPHQADLFLRGYGTSPLLGAAQGLAIFLDGVRVNEVFGDTVQWDLIHQEALATIEVIAGSQAAYGVNTLGGALQLHTHGGFRRPGHRLSVGGGSWGRQRMSLGSGGSKDRLAYFAAASLFDDDGWRDHSPTRTRHGSMRLSRRGGGTVELAVDVADNDLTGNGPAPVQLLALDRSAIFTYPDETANDLVFPRLFFERRLGEGDHLQATVSYRSSDITTRNADDFDAEDGEPDQNDLFDAADNRSRTAQTAVGATVELSRADWLPGADNLFVAGVTFERGEADFSSSTELATLTADRTTVGSGLFASDGFVDVRSRVRRASLYAVDNVPLGAGLTLNLQARYNTTRIELRDRLGTELNGDHRFDHLHPAVGLAWAPRAGGGLVLYTGIAQSSRTPTPVELTCADPEDPCRLPNAFVADPPLDDVVTTSFEIGARGRHAKGSWSAAAFGARSADDLVFISSGRLTNTGHFTNVDATRRLGLEAAVDGRAGRFGWHASYTYTDATFEAPFRVQSLAHPLAVDGEIQVADGDRLPGIPRHLGKAGVDVTLAGAAIGLDLRASSGRVMRGDEANLLDAVPGFAVADVWLKLRLGRRADLNIAVDNVFDRDYETFGVLGDPEDVLGEGFDDPRFRSPGAPRALRVGIDVALR